MTSWRLAVAVLAAAPTVTQPKAPTTALSSTDAAIRRGVALLAADQDKDGSWWDFPLYDYHQPYGTAFALMSLARCRRIEGDGSSAE